MSGTNEGLYRCTLMKAAQSIGNTKLCHHHIHEKAKEEEVIFKERKARVGSGPFVNALQEYAPDF